MRTITEYAPLIFSHIAELSQQSARRRRRIWINGLALFTYSIIGLWLAFDTGFAPWQWQFWLMFAPAFAAGELAFHALHEKQ